MAGTDNNQPIPIYGASPQNKDSAANQTPISPTNFYSSSNNPPPLPSRPVKAAKAVNVPAGIGSAYTRYAAPSASPPTYRAEGTPFREPELIEDQQSDTDSVPGLISTEVTQPMEQSGWYSGQYHSQWEGWDGTNAKEGWDSVGGWASEILARKVQINGTDVDEEDNWWDPAVREKHKRPGPGVLPPLLEDMLHHPEHSLFSVIVKPPEIIRPENPTAIASTSTAPQAAPPDGPHPSPPSKEDVVHAVPHPNAYYCRRHNGWVILQWKEGGSNYLPPLARSFQEDPLHPLPQQIRRGWGSPCIGKDTNSSTANKTHHFHYYERAVDAHGLTPPFHRQDWQMADQMKQRRRRMTTSTLGMGDLTMDAPKADDQMDQDTQEEEGDLLDLWICCQCSVSGVSSAVIPGVIPVKFIDEYTKFKQSSPMPGKTGEESVVSSWETIITILENKLWRGNDRCLPINGKSFSKKVGWNPTVQRIFEALDFTLQLSTEEKISPILIPPQTSSSTPQSNQNRAKLLRAYVEISVWLTDYQRRFAPALREYVPQKLFVEVAGARDMYQMGIGSHPDQLPRGVLAPIVAQYEPLHEAWRGLGLTPTSYTPDLLMFAYMAQCRCDPEHTSDYFTWFLNIVEAMQQRQDVPQDVQMVLMDERARGRFSHDDLQNAVKTLGFGDEGTLSIEFDEDVSDEFIAHAWRDKVKRAWGDVKEGARLQKEANDAFRIVAEARGSVFLKKAWDEGQIKTMNPERAYSTLEIPAEVDDDMVLTVFSLRIEEQPSQGDKMREALGVIAEIRDSARLRKFLETGTDPGDIVPLIRADLPRGLNQLGNTCYLNSLLQYFYTIKELRDAITPMANAGEKEVEDEKVSDDALKQHRVGGRLVTRREVGRSKKFVSQLAGLFFELEYSQGMAVTPAIELAKLALVTSRDEEEDEVDRGGTDSSNDTDATLVDDTPARAPVSDQARQSPLRSPGSVLGKRLRDESLQKSDMDVDSPQLDKDGFVIVSSPTSPHRSSTSPAEGSSSKPHEAPKEAEMIDVEMQDGTSQAVQKTPPRKPAGASDSTMMFGKQHDVAECMDNCMFQIETALLKFDGLGSADDKGSIVKRLFYGTIRQRIAAVSTDSKSKAPVNEKEDLFSNLPVNVAGDGFDIYDGLSGYFDDIVDFEGGKARMEVSLLDLPPLLQVQLQRVQFNRETLQSYKSQAYVKFDETIYMDRFLDGADPPKKARSKIIQAELNNCRERLQILTSGKHAPFSEALSSTLGFLSKQEGVSAEELDDDLVAQLNGEQDVVKTEIEDLRRMVTVHKEELEAIWRTEKKMPYDLTSVFVHRGSSPQFGHYFFYSRNLPDQPDVWFKYNDSTVTEVSKDEVFADTTGSTANPYLLVYARKGSEVIQTVNRVDSENLIEADP